MAVVDAWGSVNVSLAVMKKSIDVSAVCDFLGVDVVPSERGVVVTSGPDWWAYTYGENFSDDLESKVIAMVAQFKPRLSGVESLLEAGHAVQVAITGSVRTGSQLILSSWVIGRLASLAIPVSVTTLTDTQEEDPLSWLDG
ncbi:hypothetical protein AB0P17_29930 [Streptomyces sp. NPDC088124]|uniref:hypothetical protein n=1 Tax=Streptomyces sp. NPDC088124 TaxID=3154654 RepID=UPI003426F3AB